MHSNKEAHNQMQSARNNKLHMGPTQLKPICPTRVFSKNNLIFLLIYQGKPVIFNR